jgi:predicted protein tyrosine phosphatase
MIRVSNIRRALEIAKEMDAEAIVSIVDPDEQIPIFTNQLHLVRSFIDTEDRIDTFAPKQDDINAIFDFVIKRESQLRTLVCCAGGISRSTATAIGLHIARGVAVDNAVRLVYADSPNLSPNRLVLRLIDKRLCLKNNLVSAVKDIITTLPQELTLWCHICKSYFTEEQNCKGGHW